jgi:DNA repair exonuclease SbcCD nuclease subunit
LAAGRVFEAAILEGVAFVVLAGDILQPLMAGPRGLLFLCEQFEKLAAKGIDVYWCGGDIDRPDDWPSALSLPANVHIFPRGRVDEYLVQIDGVPAARVLGTSREQGQPIRTGEFRPDATGLFTIAVAFGEADPAMQTRGIHYWALGGRHERTTASRDVLVPASANRDTSLPSVHYSGTTQGRHFAESGVHGCTLVQVDEQNQVRTSLIPCDAARWLTERIVIENTTNRADLETLFRNRLQLLREASPKMNLLASWTVAGEGDLMHELHHGRLASELLEGLRGEFGFNSPVVWSISLETDHAEVFPPEWYEQETIRGDFLRAIEHLRMNHEESLGIEDYLPESYRAGMLGGVAMIDEKSLRRQMLDEAARLGVELLGGDQENRKDAE